MKQIFFLKSIKGSSDIIIASSILVLYSFYPTNFEITVPSLAHLVHINTTKSGSNINTQNSRNKVSVRVKFGPNPDPGWCVIVYRSGYNIKFIRPRAVPRIYVLKPQMKCGRVWHFAVTGLISNGGFKNLSRSNITLTETRVVDCH